MIRLGVRQASRIEAYREEWQVEPDQLRQPPVDGVQYREWSATVKPVEMLRLLEAPHLEHGIEHSLGMEL